jgi:hypothetical protein
MLIVVSSSKLKTHVDASVSFLKKQTLVPRKNKTSGASDDATVLAVKRKRRLEGRRRSLHASVIELGEIANFKG